MKAMKSKKLMILNIHQIKKIFHSKYKPGSTAKGFADMVKANIEFHFLDNLLDKVHI